MNSPNFVFKISFEIKFKTTRIHRAMHHVPNCRDQTWDCHDQAKTNYVKVRCRSRSWCLENSTGDWMQIDMQCNVVLTVIKTLICRLKVIEVQRYHVFVWDRISIGIQKVDHFQAGFKKGVRRYLESHAGSNYKRTLPALIGKFLANWGTRSLCLWRFPQVSAWPTQTDRPLGIAYVAPVSQNSLWDDAVWLPEWLLDDDVLLKTLTGNYLISQMKRKEERGERRGEWLKVDSFLYFFFDAIDNMISTDTVVRIGWVIESPSHDLMYILSSLISHHKSWTIGATKRDDLFPCHESALSLDPQEHEYSIEP